MYEKPIPEQENNSQTRPDPPRPRKQAENQRKTIFWGPKSISGHEKSILSMEIRFPSMKNRFRNRKMGPGAARALPDHEKPGKRAENFEKLEKLKI